MAISNIPGDVLSGRNVLRTDITTLDAATIKEDLERILPQHTLNKLNIRTLQEYVRGYHPALDERVKTTRTDVDNKIFVDYAGAITRDITGYFLGKPIQYTHREGKHRRQMEHLTNVLSAENKARVDYEIANDCSTCGVGYRGIFTEKKPRNGTKLKLLRLDPLDTFVVYPSDPTLPPAYAVTAYETTADESSKVFYKVFTTNAMYIFEDEVIQGQDAYGVSRLILKDTKGISFGGGLPIVEYQNNLWRLGDWETAITIMDAIDAVTSDGVNDIQQAVNSVLVAMGMKLTEDDFKKLSTNGFLNVTDIPVGVKPVVEFINQAMSADVGTAMRDYLEATLRVVVGVPDRKSRPGGGGDTGDAVFMRDGWQDIDLVATAKEPYFIQAERESLSVMLYVLSTNKEVKKLSATDVEIHFNRNKTANLQSKAQVFQTLIGSGMAPRDALDIAGLTNNVEDVILRMEEYAPEYAKTRMNQGTSSTTDSNSDEGGAS